METVIDCRNNVGHWSKRILDRPIASVVANLSQDP